jgi:methionyl-tRNA synthetase
MKRLLVTAGLPYSNGRLHVGHIGGAYLPADIFVRFQRLRGRDVRYVCGSDDHGVAIMLAAEKEGKTPAEVAAHYNKLQKADFDALNIKFDIYGATSSTPSHKSTCQEFFLSMYEKGYFEKKTTRQFYDAAKNIFLPDRYVKGTCGFCSATDQYGDQCEQCGRELDVDSLKDARSIFSNQPATARETTHWFLDLSRFNNQVAEWVDKSVLRENTRSFVQGLLSAGLVKRSMTRDISWGIPLPLDEQDAKDKVLYVWFDAPIGYISNTKEMCLNEEGDEQGYEKWWKSKDCEVIHFIGEDNTVFHCIIWIAMLSAEGSFSLPSGVIVNQFYNIQFAGQAEAEKISKSRGNAVWIGDYIASGGDPDALRYYLTANATERARTAYRPDDLIHKANSDLANTLGNFVNRVTSFCAKHFDNSVPSIEQAFVTGAETNFLERLKECFAEMTLHLEKYEFKAAQESAIEFARFCNKYVDEKAPWKQIKEDRQEAAVTVFYALQGIHFLGETLRPFLPALAERILKVLGLSNSSAWEQAIKELPSGMKLGEREIIFQKIETSKSE